MFVQARPFPQALQACSLKAAKLFSSVTAHEPPCSWRNIWAQLDQSTSDEAKEPDASSWMWQAALPVAFGPNTPETRDLQRSLTQLIARAVPGEWGQ